MLFLKNSLKVALLTLLVAIGGAVLSLLRLTKSETQLSSSDSKKLSIFPSVLSLPEEAYADVPASGGGGGDPISVGGGSTPFIAVWDGAEYRLENDILFGKPTSFFADFDSGKSHYESNMVGPDLYKINSKFVEKDGALSFQLQEIEDEESFIHGLTLTRVIHPSESEVITDADYKRFHVVDSVSFEKNLIRPAKAVDITGRNVTEDIQKMHPGSQSNHLSLHGGHYVDLTFEGLTPNTPYYLVLQSRFRRWMPGIAPSQASIFKTIFDSGFARFGIPAALALGATISDPGILAGLPLFALCESCGSGSGGSEGGGCSLWVYAIDSTGKMRFISRFESRALKHVLELGELPQELWDASGKLSLRILATDHHYVSLAALLPKPEEHPYRTETVSVKYAWHHRLNREVTEFLNFAEKKYLHLIPGDRVDITFEKPASVVPSDMRETYLLRAGGFYTYLTPETRNSLPENWEINLSAEAKAWRRSIHLT